MKPYNTAFFGLFQNIFFILRENFGEKQAITLFTTTMEKGLKSSYGDDFVKGDPKSFVKTVGERDVNVGLEVKFKDVTEESFIYEFHTDPFPLLKNELPPVIIDATYMNFKVKYLLGPDWNYKTTKHLWHGDSCTQHVIYKSSNDKNKPGI